MFKKIVTTSLLVAATALPFVSQAEITQKSGRSVEQIYKQCGLGGLIFGDSSEILAVISNVTLDLGTTAALSDSLSPDTCNDRRKRTAMLIKEAFPSVEKDLAVGSGAYLSALNDAANCQSTSVIRNKYGLYTQSSAYQSATKEENVEALYSIVEQSCAM